MEPSEKDRGRIIHPRDLSIGFTPPLRSTEPLPSAIWASKEELAGEDWRDDEGRRLLLGVSDDGTLLAFGGGPLGRQDDRHIVTIAGARAGKSSTCIIPNLRRYRGSMLVIDIKGELAQATAAKRREFGNVLILDPFGVTGMPTDAINPLDEIDPLGENVLSKLDIICEALIVQDVRDTHWTDGARDLMRFAILFAFLIAPLNGQPTLATVRKILSGVPFNGRTLTGRTVQNGMFPYLMEAEADNLFELARDAAEELITLAASFADTPEKELGSMLSACRRQIGFLRGDAMARVLDSSPASLRDVKSKPTTIYVCLPPSKLASHHRWLRLLVMLAVEASEVGPKPDIDMVFVLDEFAALGHMDTLQKASAQMAGYGVKLWVVLQDLSQLQRDYPKDWETFLENASAIQAFANDGGTTTEYLEKRLGLTTYVERRAAERTIQGAAAGAKSTVEEKTRAPLVPAFMIGQLFARHTNRQLLLRKGLRPVNCLRLPREQT
jgi:type IV secretion system protein VirD4